MRLHQVAAVFAVITFSVFIAAVPVPDTDTSKCGRTRNINDWVGKSYKDPTGTGLIGTLKSWAEITRACGETTDCVPGDNFRRLNVTHYAPGVEIHISLKSECGTGGTWDALYCSVLLDKISHDCDPQFKDAKRSCFGRLKSKCDGSVLELRPSYNDGHGDIQQEDSTSDVSRHLLSDAQDAEHQPYTDAIARDSDSEDIVSTRTASTQDPTKREHPDPCEIKGHQWDVTCSNKSVSAADAESAILNGCLTAVKGAKWYNDHNLVWPDVTFADGVLDAVAAVHLGKFYRNGDLWSVETCQYLFRNQLIERCGGWKGSERYNTGSAQARCDGSVIMLGVTMQDFSVQVLENQ